MYDSGYEQGKADADIQIERVYITQAYLPNDTPYSDRPYGLKAVCSYKDSSGITRYVEGNMVWAKNEVKS